MLFNSLAFAIFLPIVFLLYWAVPQKYRWIILLISSYYFYMSWNVKYVVLILFTTFVSYCSALFLPKFTKKSTKLGIMWLAIVASLFVLFFFKYLNFAQNTLIRILQSFAIELHPLTLKLLLPVGISFYTFQTLSYVIDVYKGEVEPERNFFKYAAFISFFPQLVAGPIERTRNLLPQIDCEHKFTYEKASYGIKLMAWGFFKKLVIADNLATLVDGVFDHLDEYQGFSFVLAILFFTIQIYCDFSGYSDIAIGTAKLFDIDLMTNFKSPYFSTSVQDFWRRWHISLSSWFRDYVYIPLGGSRVSKFRHYINLCVTFLCSGLWHGAAFTYVAWGGLHGLMQCVENLLFGKRIKAENKQERALKNRTGSHMTTNDIGETLLLRRGSLVWWIRVLVVFVLVSIAWCFFRAGSLTQAVWVLWHSLDGVVHPISYIKNGFGAFDNQLLKQLIAPVVLLGVYDYAALSNDPIKTVSVLKKPARYAIYYAFVLFVLLFASFSSQEFVYFQF